MFEKNTYSKGKRDHKNTFVIARKDYSNLQNSFYMFHIKEKIKGEKIAAEIEPAVNKSRIRREGMGSETFN